MKRPVYLSLLCVGALTTMGVPADAALAAGSHPSSDIVEVSRDGLVYARDYSELFDGRLLVPRGSARDTFVVKNTGSTSGFLRIVLTAVAIPDRAVLHALTISAGTPGRPGALLPVAVAQPCLALMGGRLLAPGQSVQVVSELALGDLTATTGQHASIAFALEILLSERVGQDDEGCPVAQTMPSVPGAPLADTGLSVAGSVGSIALALIVVGGALAVRFRRRSKPQNENAERRFG